MNNILRLLVAAVIVIQPIQGWSLDVMQIISILSSFLPKGEKPSPFAKEEKKEEKPKEEPTAAEKPTAVVLKDETTTEPKAEGK